MTAADPTQTAGAGGDPASTEVTPASSAPPEAADFVRRAQADPQWASDQVRQFQSAADSAEAARSKLAEQYEPVKALIDQFGGTTVAAAVENYRAVRNSAEIGEVIQEFERTGQLPVRKGSEPKVDNDEYKTPEEQKIEALEVRLDRAEANTSANTLASGKTVLQGHMEKVSWGYKQLTWKSETGSTEFADEVRE